MDREFPHYHALRWIDERQEISLMRNPSWKSCCKQGSVQLQLLSDPPEYLGEKWKLSTGTIVEIALYNFSKRCVVDHPSCLTILGLDDATGLKYDINKHHDLDWVKHAMHSYIRLCESKELNTVQKEQWYNKHIWLPIDTVFSDILIRYHYYPYTSSFNFH
jgi:hypothetical protein